MKLRIPKPAKPIQASGIRTIKEKESHQFQYYGRQGFLGRAPCRASIQKLTPEDVMNRANLCPSDGWRYCNLVDGKGNVLDSITVEKAWSKSIKNIYKKMGSCSRDLPEVRGAIC